MRVLVRGVGDIGSAVARRLFREGHSVVIHDEPTPATTRRGMAFADAVFERRASLEGVEGILSDDLQGIWQAFGGRAVIPIYIGPLGSLLVALRPNVLVDARMKKHSVPEVQRGLADFTIGLGPSLTAGRHADVVVETSWDDLGRVIREGSSRALGGEPREIDGHARDRYVYAPIAGVFGTKAQIGDLVHKDHEVGTIDATSILAPLDGALRGLTRHGVPVSVGTKIVEVDPRGSSVGAFGIAERPRRIADAVLSVVAEWTG